MYMAREFAFHAPTQNINNFNTTPKEPLRGDLTRSPSPLESLPLTSTLPSFPRLLHFRLLSVLSVRRHVVAVNQYPNLIHPLWG